LEEPLALPDKDLMAAIAVTRFGLGARPGEIEAARSDPQGFLKAQIRKEGADQPAGQLPNSQQRLAEFRAFQQVKQAEKRQAPAAANDQRPAMAMMTQAQRRDAVGVGEEFEARLRLALGTPAAFRERWTLFWADHFTVSAVKQQSANQAGPFEREAIRPHVFGRFEDMLIASSTHPGMMIYLDQVQSVGPNSLMATRVRRNPGPKRRQPGLNENLAREIMELHSVGLRAAYTQADVTEFARAMTGLSVGGPNDGSAANTPVFREPAHEPGARTIMGKRYPDTGKLQAVGVMRDLAAHPATARHVAIKLARHFVADDPPKAVVTRLEQAFTDSGGRLDVLANVLIDSPEAWAPQQAKFKNPHDFVVSSWRAVGTSPRNPQQIVQGLNTLGQRPFSAPSPKGWPDDAVTWAAPDAIVKRLAWSQNFAAANAAAEPMKIAQAALGARLTPTVQAAIVSAESRPEALAILLMSPEFQRR
jgi:uncharacterized protein (DUF1800 family)